MKSAIDPSSNSVLNGSIDLTAEDYFRKFTPKQIAQMEYKQGVATWPGISFMINDDWTWRDGFILEGVNVLPKLVSKEQIRNSNLQAIFLSDRDTLRTKEIIYTRGLYDKADSYPDALKERELEWVKIFDEIILKEAKKYHQPVVEIDKNSNDLTKILEILS